MNTEYVRSGVVVGGVVTMTDVDDMGGEDEGVGRMVGVRVVGVGVSV